MGGRLHGASAGLSRAASLAAQGQHQQQNSIVVVARRGPQPQHASCECGRARACVLSPQEVNIFRARPFKVALTTAHKPTGLDLRCRGPRRTGVGRRHVPDAGQKKRRSTRQSMYRMFSKLRSASRPTTGQQGHLEMFLRARDNTHTQTFQNMYRSQTILRSTPRRSHIYSPPSGNR